MVKIILAFLFSSQYSSELFLPFLNSASLVNWNPWQLYYDKGILDAFPYHGLMFFLLVPFAFLGELLGSSGFLIKLPLIIADLSILIVLLKLLRNYENRVLFYYFLSQLSLYYQ